MDESTSSRSCAQQCELFCINLVYKPGRGHNQNPNLSESNRYYMSGTTSIIMVIMPMMTNASNRMCGYKTICNVASNTGCYDLVHRYVQLLPVDIKCALSAVNASAVTAVV